MWDVLRLRMARPDVSHAGIGGLAGFAEGIIARIEVFAFLRK